MRSKAAKYYKLQHTLLDRTADAVLATSSHRNIFDTLWVPGDAQIHTRRFTPAKLPQCSIAAS